MRKNTNNVMDYSLCVTTQEKQVELIPHPPSTLIEMSFKQLTSESSTTMIEKQSQTIVLEDS